MNVFRARPPAKINLFLEAGRKRPDGYHEIVTVMAPVGIHDEVEIRPARRFSLTVEGAVLKGQNSMEKAWRAVRRRRRIPPVAVRLVKNIPAGSGLGGGSSDAAFMLRGLDRMFDAGRHVDLNAIAANVGSDVPFFMQDGPALCTGRGENVAPLAHPIRGWAVIVWPGYGLSTKSVYMNHKNLTSTKDVIEFLNPGRIKLGIDVWGRRLFNRLETSAFGLKPGLRAVYRRLKRLPFAGVRMTGSGTAIYGVCAGRVVAERLARRLSGTEPHVAVGALLKAGAGTWRSRKSASSL